MFLKTLFTENILVLKNGSVITADEIWVTGDTTYYRIGEETRSVKQNDVRRILSDAGGESGDFANRAVYALQATWNYLVAFVPSTIPPGKVVNGKDGVADGRHGVLIGILAVLSIGGIVVAVWQYITRSHKKPRPNGMNSEVGSAQHYPALSSVRDVELFLLDVFRRQIGTARDAPARIIPVSKRSQEATRIYDLQVKHQGKWKSRRISIGILGEGTGSKSQCFYVVYDNHMVVKIPAAPIRDFKEYARRIKQESAVVKRLAPLECIIPNVSMILDKVRILPDTDGLTFNALEDKYIHWLETYPQLQSYLKIGDAFAFFMDLSQYRFLSQVMDRLHDLERDVHRTVFADADIVWDYNEFSNKYGDDNGTVCFDLQRAYAKFHQETKQLLTAFECADALNEKEKMEWFLLHLAGEAVVRRPEDLPEQLVVQIKLLLDGIAAAYPDVADTYKKLAVDYVKKRSFNRKRSQFEGIVSNLLSLLDWMRLKDVSMRDIKPDNLLVAGNLDENPFLLASPDDYTIGLIDVETAAILEKGPKQIIQPLLGGTPLYATPSHFFTNELLQDVYEDVTTILVLQDWFAATGIIYEVMTAEKLFLNTANKIHGIIQKLRMIDKRKRSTPTIYWNINRYFWHTAAEEFADKLGRAEATLHSAHVTIPAGIKEWLEHNRIRMERGDDSRSKFTDLLDYATTKLSVHDLLASMFDLVMDNMLAAKPDKMKTGVLETDVGITEGVPVATESESQVLGFTFTV